MEGPAMIKYLAMIAAWVGNKDLACEQLAIVMRRPSGLSYGELKLQPLQAGFVATRALKNSWKKRSNRSH